jgi:hypothetical protein
MEIQLETSFEMKIRLFRFGYPDFGQAIHTHPEGNPNDFNTALP